MNKKQHKFITAVILSLLSLTFTCVLSANTASANFEDGNAQYCLNNDGSKKSDTDINGVDGGGIAGSFTKNGSSENKNAKKLWNAFKDKGYGGSAIAGVLGNVAVEGGFSLPDRPQGYYGNDPDAGLHVGKVRSKGGGGGYFQITPLEEFAHYGDKKWLDLGAQISFLEKVKMSSFDEKKYATLSSPTEAAQMWGHDLEKPGDLNASIAERKANAQKAYNTFGGADVKANGSIIGGANQANSDTNVDDKLTKDVANNCGTNSSSNDVADGTGSIDSKYMGQAWSSYDEVPDAVKKYAHDPAKLLGKRGSSSKWSQLGVNMRDSADQCVGFTVAYGNALWGMKGNLDGNGVDMANSMASRLHIKTSKTPHAGSIFGQQQKQPAGHTGIILHVLANGDMVIAEQNYAGKSGSSNGESCSWDIRTVTKSDMEAHNTNYANPADAKKKLNWG